MVWLFMMGAIFLALIFLGADMITRCIGYAFDCMVEAVKQARRNEGQNKEEKL